MTNIPNSLRHFTALTGFLSLPFFAQGQNSQWDHDKSLFNQDQKTGAPTATSSGHKTSLTELHSAKWNLYRRVMNESEVHTPEGERLLQEYFIDVADSTDLFRGQAMRKFKVEGAQLDAAERDAARRYYQQARSYTDQDPALLNSTTPPTVDSRTQKVVKPDETPRKTAPRKSPRARQMPNALRNRYANQRSYGNVPTLALSTEHQETLYQFASFRVPMDESYAESMRYTRRVGAAMLGAPRARYDATPEYNKDGSLVLDFIGERVRLGGAPVGVDPEMHYASVLALMDPESSFNPLARPYVYKTVHVQKWSKKHKKYVTVKKKERIWDAKKHDWKTLSSAEGLGQFLKGTRKDLAPRVGVPYPKRSELTTTPGIDTQIDYINLHYFENMQRAQEWHEKLVKQGKKSPVGQIYMTQHGKGKNRYYEAHVVTIQSLGWAMWAGQTILEDYRKPARYVGGYPVAPNHMGQDFSKYLGIGKHEGEESILSLVNDFVQKQGYRTDAPKLAQSKTKRNISSTPVIATPVKSRRRVRYHDKQAPVTPVANSNPVNQSRQRLSSATKPVMPAWKPTVTSTADTRLALHMDNHQAMVAAAKTAIDKPARKPDSEDRYVPQVQADYRQNRNGMQWTATNTAGVKLNYVIV